MLLGKFLDISELGLDFACVHALLHLFNKYLRWDIAFGNVSSYRFKVQTQRWGCSRREVLGTLPLGET